MNARYPAPVSPGTPNRGGWELNAASINEGDSNGDKRAVREEDLGGQSAPMSGEKSANPAPAKPPRKYTISIARGDDVQQAHTATHAVRLQSWIGKFPGNQIPS